MANEHDEKKTEGTVEDASVELSVDDLEEASGGYVLDRGRNIKDSFPYVVVDDKTGEKSCYNNILGNAQETAKANGFSTEVIAAGYLISISSSSKRRQAGDDQERIREAFARVTRRCEVGIHLLM